jgi:hypothetical protein
MSQITQMKAIMESFWAYSYQSQVLIVEITLKITLGAMNEIIQTF